MLMSEVFSDYTGELYTCFCRSIIRSRTVFSSL